MVPGGIIVCCDGMVSLDMSGAAKAMDEFVRTNPKKLCNLTTGQGFIDYLIGENIMLDSNGQNALLGRSRKVIGSAISYRSIPLGRGVISKIDFEVVIYLTVLKLCFRKPMPRFRRWMRTGIGYKLMGEGYRVTGVSITMAGYRKILLTNYVLSSRFTPPQNKEFQATFDAVTIIEVIEHIPAEFLKASGKYPQRPFARKVHSSRACPAPGYQ